MIGRGVVVTAALTAVVNLVACTASTPHPSSSTSPPSPSTSRASTASAGPPASALPNTLYRRHPLRTAHGDPVRVDFCAALGLRYLKPFRHRVRSSRALLGCTTTLRTGRGKIIFVVDGTLVAKSSARRATRAGVCVRSARQGSVAYLVTATRRGPDRFAPQTCKIANATARRFSTVWQQAQVPTLRLARPSLTALDWCRVLKATSRSPIPGFGAPRFRHTDLGLGCTAYSAKYRVSAGVALGRAPKYATVTEGSHKLRARHTARGCEFVSVQGRELLTISLRQQGKDVAFCDRAQHYVRGVLDTAGFD